MTQSLRQVLREGLDRGSRIRHRWLWRATPPRALVEMLAVILPLFAALLAAHATLVGMPLMPGLYVVSGSAGMYLAARMRHPSGRLWLQVVWEGLAAAAMVLALTIVYGSLLTAAISAGYLEGLPSSAVTTAVLVVVQATAFIGLRVLLRLWFAWDHLRRRRLVFAITHVYLTIALAASLPFVLALAIYIGTSGFSQVVITQGNLPVAIAIILIIGIFPAFAFLMLLVLAGEVMLMPPFALIAYLAARRVTGRLLSLAQAAESMRQGDYSARVAVGGEDEVAQLQGNFNAMAAHLQQALADLQAERDRVAGLLDSRRELVANVSHELRTPVATVRAYLDSIIEGQQAPSAERMQHDLQVMEAEMTHLQGLIEELFALSRSEVGPLALRLAPTDVAAAVNAAVDAMAPLAWRSGSVQVLATLPPSLPAAFADAARLHQVLANLLRNAVRHTPPGGIVAVSAEADGDTIVVAVRDTGDGIAAEDLPHVWERFYRGPEGDGAGLGLAIVKEMVTAMQGSVAVESAPGQGCCFSVRLNSC
ncbi:MAG: sensor histidine kinase [Anaerolineae bacterium]